MWAHVGGEACQAVGARLLFGIGSKSSQQCNTCRQCALLGRRHLVGGRCWFSNIMTFLALFRSIGLWMLSVCRLSDIAVCACQVSIRFALLCLAMVWLAYCSFAWRCYALPAFAVSADAVHCYRLVTLLRLLRFRFFVLLCFALLCFACCSCYACFACSACFALLCFALLCFALLA